MIWLFLNYFKMCKIYNWIIVLNAAFGEKWKKKKNNTFKWTGNTKLIGLVVDAMISLAELIEKSYVKLNVDLKKTNMHLSYTCTSWDMSNHPTYITNDECVLFVNN